MSKVRNMRNNLIILFQILIIFTVASQQAQMVPAVKINPLLLNNHWNAQWITHPNASVLEYGVFHFRKNFKLTDVPSEFIIHVSADNRYRLFVNGVPVSFGPARGDLANWYYESIDIAGFLKPGNNLLASVVWNFGEEKPWAQISLKTAFIVQGNQNAEQIINTDASWKVIQNNSYKPYTENTQKLGEFIVIGPGDELNAALYPWDWEEENHQDQQWPEARVLDQGHPRGVGTDINWVLTPRLIPALEQKFQRFASVRQTSGQSAPKGFIEGKSKWTIPANQKISILFDQAVLTTGYPELNVSMGNGSQIKLVYAEALFDSLGNKGNRNIIEGKQIKGYADLFIPDGGHERIFRPLWFRTWRYLELEIETKNEPLIINDFTSEFVVYPLAEIASFNSDQEILNRIWNTGWRTARLCANETFYDCPYYEQLQYIGDTRIQALISLYVSGDDRLVRNALLQFDGSRFSEGLTQSRYPSASPQVIPPFSLFWVNMVHDYWTLREDPDFIKSFLPGIDSVLNWFIQRIDPDTGLLGKVEYWNFVDWTDEWPWINEKRIGGVPLGGRFDGQSSILTMQLAYALERASALNEHYGKPEQARKYKELAEKLGRGVFEKCWDESRRYLSDTPDKTDFSAHAQILGVLTNAIREADQKAIIERVLSDPNLIQPTLYFRFYLTQAMKKTGLADRYLKTLGPWKSMLDNGLSTFAEKQDPTRSDCHAWSASPNYDFLATVAGIRPASPGFKTLEMKPAFGELKFIKGQMPHPLGMILFDLKRPKNGGVQGTVTLPKGLSGTFVWKNKIVEIREQSEIKF